MRRGAGCGADRHGVGGRQAGRLAAAGWQGKRGVSPFHRRGQPRRHSGQVVWEDVHVDGLGGLDSRGVGRQEEGRVSGHRTQLDGGAEYRLPSAGTHTHTHTDADVVHHENPYSVLAGQVRGSVAPHCPPPPADLM